MSRRGRDFAGRTPVPGGSVRPVTVLAILEALKRRLDALQPSLAADLTALAGGGFRALTGARGGRERLWEVWDELTNVKERVPRPVYLRDAREMPVHDEPVWGPEKEGTSRSHNHAGVGRWHVRSGKRPTA